MRLLVWGIAFDEREDGEPERAARDECEATWGTSEGCLVVDACGMVLLNTSGVTLEEVAAT